MRVVRSVCKVRIFVRVTLNYQFVGSSKLFSPGNAFFFFFVNLVAFKIHPATSENFKSNLNVRRLHTFN